MHTRAAQILAVAASGCAVAILALAAWAAALRAWFLSDDLSFVSRLAAEGPAAVWFGRDGGFLRPLVSLSLAADLRLWGVRPLGFHATSLLIHAVNAVLVARLPAALGAPRGRASHLVPPLLGAVFLLLPSHSEAVAWISSRGDLLATAFGLVALLGYLAHRRSGRPAPLALSLAAFAAGLLSKEAIATLPLMLVALEGCRARAAAGRWRPPARALRAAALHFGVLAGYLALRCAALGTPLGGYGAERHLAFPPGLVLRNLCVFAARSVLPPLPADGFLACAGLGLAAGGAFAWRSARLRPPEAPLLAWLAGAFALALLPVANLGISATGVEGERYLYWPSVFAWSAIAVAASRLAPRALLAAAVPVLAACWWALCASSAGWERAGELATRLAHEAAAVRTAGHVYVVALPDSVAGHHVYRNGFLPGVGLAGGAPDAGPLVVVPPRWVQLDARDRLRAEPLGERAWRISAARGHFQSPHASADGEGFRVREAGPGGFRLELTGDPGRGDVVLLYDGGGWRRLR